MSGLVSKWANEDDLVKQAEIQDASKKGKDGIKGARTTRGDEPLESKWATVEPKNHDKNSNKSFLKEKSPKKTDKGEWDGGRHSIPSHEFDKSGRGQARDVDDRRRFHRSHQSKAEAARLNSSHASLEPSLRRGRKSNPTNEAGLSLAERLNISPNSNKKSNQNLPAKSAIANALDSDVETCSNNDCRTPMSEAGMSLARRLGMISVKDESHIDPKIPKKFNGNASHKPSITDRKKKLEQKSLRDKELKEKQKAEKLREEQLKEEIKETFEKLTNASFNWADLEDE